MKRIVICCSLIVMLVGIGAASAARAQAVPETTLQATIIQDMATVGLAYGQSLRISVFNPLEPAEPGEDGQKHKMLFAVTLLNADGREIARSDEITLDPGAFHFFDFNRAALPLAGEARTGRVQVRAQVRYRTFQLLDRTPLRGRPTSIELIDNSTGTTTAVWVTIGFFEVKEPASSQ